MSNSEVVTKIQPLILRVAKQRLDYAWEQRNGEGLGHITQGMILTELIMAGLPPAPGEKRPVAPAVKKTRAADALRVVAG